jgi:hypothetical protein
VVVPEQTSLRTTRNAVLRRESLGRFVTTLIAEQIAKQSKGRYSSAGSHACEDREERRHGGHSPLLPHVAPAGYPRSVTTSQRKHRRSITNEELESLAKELADDGYVLTIDEVRDAVARTVDFLRVIHEELPPERLPSETEDLPLSLQ